MNWQSVTKTEKEKTTKQNRTKTIKTRNTQTKQKTTTKNKQKKKRKKKKKGVGGVFFAVTMWRCSSISINATCIKRRGEKTTSCAAQKDLACVQCKGN